MLSPKVENALRGIKGKHTPQPGDGDYLDAPTVRTLARLLPEAGVAPRDEYRVYLARRLRWLLGKGDVPIPPSGLVGAALDFINRRAVELVDEHRDRLPAPDERRMGTR